MTTIIIMNQLIFIINSLQSNLKLFIFNITKNLYRPAQSSSWNTTIRLSRNAFQMGEKEEQKNIENKDDNKNNNDEVDKSTTPTSTDKPETSTAKEPIVLVDVSELEAKHANSFYDEVEIEDMEFNEEERVFYYPCPCGDRFVITEEEILAGEEVAKCPSCSLLIKVIYSPEDFIIEEDS
ncbi:diphthamide biosynthesis protein 3 [Cavenderia fasciculata]|uniref:Diphthamide biosynthesis protein 3 n=1 Tax=Cavenderia fasciculata TaxID=261658 RepID=F4QB69_CACFS|nr:diphthamide biosynthesis protein 3 [Cavenderia fasciculata]EGG14841.1 diphthamide biosynthesis protein 3 [Cavenderia fasciculata]|eukprot:XP_004351357.1 diphthamide biosynthesis protein 3 [Cavenderia fasciculata]